MPWLLTFSVLLALLAGACVPLSRVMARSNNHRVRDDAPYVAHAAFGAGVIAVLLFVMACLVR